MYRLEKETGDIVISGWEQGIAPSPHKGIGNLKSVDINTEMGEVMCSYGRTSQLQAQASSGTITRTGDATVSFSPAPTTGTWVAVTGGAGWGLANGNYFVTSSTTLSTTYYPGTAVSGLTAGTATWSAIAADDLALPVQSQIETYTDSSGVTQYRYYVVDTHGRLYVHDSAVTAYNWALPYPSPITTYSGAAETVCTGLGFLNGWIFIFGGSSMWVVSSSQLGNVPVLAFATNSTFGIPSITPHFAFTGHQGKMYYTDTNLIGSVFPDTSLLTSINNIQSYCRFTASSSTGTITDIISGTLPTPSTYGSTTRVPAWFFAAPGGAIPSSMSAGTVYYIDYTPGLSTYATFNVYDAITGGSAKNISSGASGLQYFNTFFPVSNQGAAAYTFTQERVNLPSFEVATCLAENDNTILIGTKSNILYSWNQIDPTPSDLLPMPENYTYNLVTVNNSIYAFVGNRGNIYVTNGSSVSLAMTVPDYCTGLIEPYFLWGGAMYMRGRVWFSIQDQNAGNLTGNCGGVWSFVPTQNFSITQDVGLALRMDNQNSYGTYNGRAVLLIPNQNQAARGPQYYSAWINYDNGFSNPTYGIDSSAQNPSTIATSIDTDIIPIGTMLSKKTLSQIEYKLAQPLDVSFGTESVSIKYRTDLTTSFASLGTLITEPYVSGGLAANNISGYYPVNFEKSQWIQLRVTLTPNGNGGTFIRLAELRIR